VLNEGGTPGAGGATAGAMYTVEELTCSDDADRTVTLPDRLVQPVTPPLGI
jgi:hypothetical protein